MILLSYTSLIYFRNNNYYVDMQKILYSTKLWREKTLADLADF